MTEPQRRSDRLGREFGWSRTVDLAPPAASPESGSATSSRRAGAAPRATDAATARPQDSSPGLANAAGLNWLPPASNGLPQNPPVGSELPLGCFVPEGYEANYQYPLVVWLHGCHQDQRQIAEVMPLVSHRNHLGIGPQGLPVAGHETGHEKRGSRFGWPDTEAGRSDAAERVFAALEWAQQQWSINPERIFLAGSGAGGTMALRIALRYADCFAGCISLDGGFPQGGQPLVAFRASRRLPLLLTCRRGSRTYPISRACDDLRLLTTAGLQVDFRQYPGGSEGTPAMLADVNRWLMSHLPGAVVS